MTNQQMLFQSLHFLIRQSAEQVPLQNFLAGVLINNLHVCLTLFPLHPQTWEREAALRGGGVHQILTLKWH